MNTPCINSYKLLCSSGYDLRLWGVRSCVRIQRTTFFYFSSRKYFTIYYSGSWSPRCHMIWGAPKKLLTEVVKYITIFCARGKKAKHTVI